MQGSSLTKRNSGTPTAQPLAYFAKARGVARSASVLLLLAGASLLLAQTSPCLTSINETSQLVYPPIARAAHVSGMVIVLARFDKNGLPVDLRIVSGPPLLQVAAVQFVKGWRANEYSGPRECPIVIKFDMIEGEKPVCSSEEAGPPRFSRSDLQHVSLSTQALWLCDPEVTITKTRKHWF